MPRTLADVWHVSKRAAAASYILPLVGTLIAITGFCISIVSKMATVLRKVVKIELVLMAALAIVISVLLEDVPSFALVFLPLGFALYSARKG